MWKYEKCKFEIEKIIPLINYYKVTGQNASMINSGINNVDE